MTTPPKYPRVPHLIAGRGAGDDVLLRRAAVDELLEREVVVEEKLDGANVVVWLDDDRLTCALRSGPGGQDRARQLGPLRGWLAERGDPLRHLLGSGRTLYGEWLLLTHTIAYDELSAYLVGLDILLSDGRFARVDERNRLVSAAGIPRPPELFRGVPGGLAALERLIGQSRAGAQTMEGLIVRTLDGSEPRVTKIVRPAFAPAGDDAWRSGRPRNLLTHGQTSWR
jgi:RNA ligase